MRANVCCVFACVSVCLACSCLFAGLFVCLCASDCWCPNGFFHELVCSSCADAGFEYEFRLLTIGGLDCVVLVTNAGAFCRNQRSANRCLANRASVVQKADK